MKKNFDDRIVKILKLIDQDCTINVTEIAAECGFCNNHVSKIFKEAMGISIKEYINKKRMEIAYNLAKNTDMSIEGIMEKIGLNNRTHFYNLFKKYVGKTPGQLRK